MYHIQKMAQYTINPLTGRPILVGGPTFNRLVIEAYDYIDRGLVRRTSAPPLNDEPLHRYLNTVTGRMVQEGSRTFQFLTNQLRYNIIENYYLLPPNAIHIDRDVMDTIQVALDAGNEIMQQHREVQDNHRIREQQMSRLAELNITLCRDCQMPIKADSELCDECIAEPKEEN